MPVQSSGCMFLFIYLFIGFPTYTTYALDLLQKLDQISASLPRKIKYAKQ